MARRKMILRAKTFRAWFNANLKANARDIARHGADTGWPCITYTSDTCDLFDKYGHEIMDMAVEDARDQGCKNVAEMIAGFGRADMLDGGLDGFKNLMVWYACEKVANEIEDAKESA